MLTRTAPTSRDRPSPWVVLLFVCSLAFASAATLLLVSASAT
jgi:hypothetical protein